MRGHFKSYTINFFIVHRVAALVKFSVNSNFNNQSIHYLTSMSQPEKFMETYFYNTVFEMFPRYRLSPRFG